MPAELARGTAVTIAILTFRRPPALRRALPEILGQAHALAVARGFRVRVLVVDNDPQASARAVAAEFRGSALDYVVEPTPGIAAARNRALDECALSDAIVFIDDDESPRERWLEALINTWEQTGAAAVMGRVVSVFDSEPDPFVAAGEFFRRPRMASGSRIPVAAAGNLLLDIAQVRAAGVRFDERFGLSGGEDTLFSRQLAASGAALVWCDESAASDHVPAERATRRWVLARARRSANTSVNIDLFLARGPLARLAIRARSLVGGLARVVGGPLGSLAGAAARNPLPRARGFRVLYRGIGMITAALGVHYQEYARDE